MHISLQKRMTKLAGECSGSAGEEADDVKSSSSGLTLQKRMTKLAGGCPGYGSGDDANNNTNTTVAENRQPLNDEEEEREEVSKLVGIMT